MNTVIENIKHKLQGNYANKNETLSFCRYHNLYHWFLASQNIDPDVKGLISKEYHQKKLHNLLLLDEWNKLKRKTDGKIKLFLLKGISLSNQLFGDIATRPTRDLDIYIYHDDIIIADYLIKECGYRRIKPDIELNHAQQKYIYRHIHHFTYINDKNIIIELHWQLFTPRSLFKHGELVFKYLQPSNIDTYPNEWLLHYLITHGSMHHWFKLFWLYDIHWLITYHPINWTQVEQHIQTFGNRRMLNVALHLVNEFFGTQIPAKKNLSQIEKKITQYCIKSIYSNENYLLLKGTKRFKRTYYLSLLKPNISYKFSTWLAPLTTIEDWKTLPLPSKLYWTYYVIRPFVWLYTNYLKRPS